MTVEDEEDIHLQQDILTTKSHQIEFLSHHHLHSLIIIVVIICQTHESWFTKIYLLIIV